jgi:Protein of unknown function (DUF3592)
MRWARACCGFVGIAILTWAALDWRHAANFQQLALRVRGTVIGVREEDQGHGRMNYFSRVEFMTADGHRHKFSSESGKPKPPRIGDEVSVLYDPVMPDWARVDEPDGDALLRMLLAAGGLCLVLFGALSMRPQAATPSH